MALPLNLSYIMKNYHYLFVSPYIKGLLPTCIYSEPYLILGGGGFYLSYDPNIRGHIIRTLLISGILSCR